MSVLLNITNQLLFGACALQNTTDDAPLQNPALVRLDAEGILNVQMKSTTSSCEISEPSAVVGNVVRQKSIMQAAQQ